MPRNSAAKVYDILPDENRHEIYRWAAEGRSVGDITSIFNRKYKPQDVGRHSKLQSKTITKVLCLPEAEKYVGKYRLEFLSAIRDIPITEKRIRLADLELMRQKTMLFLKNVQASTNISPRAFTQYLALIKKMTEILALAKEEMEPKNGINIGIGIGGTGEFADINDEQLHDERDALLKKLRGPVNEGAQEAGSLTDGNEEEGEGESPQVLLAPSGELRRNDLRERATNFSDIRQQEGHYKGMPAE